ncbi:MAG TPA: Uma2 family endonuclease, partial [Pirellulales bacterium]|nr:Uma2 family endonuclease [Pirellulales bacterium]
GRPMELVRGVVVMMNMPGGRHGQVCWRIAAVLDRFLEGRDLGQAFTNDTGVITERGPDTVRGADLSYYSFSRLPFGPAPRGYPPNPPEVVFEVRSPTDAWSELIVKTGEYLKAGVLAVALFEPDDWKIHVYRPNSPPIVLTADDTLELPEIHEDFRVAAARFFEPAR